MIELENTTALQIDIDLLQQIADDVTDQEVELLIVDAQAIRELNLEYRGKDAPTDVLSFPQAPMPMAPLGSIVICDSFVQQGAITHGHTEMDECALLFIHGLLHLVGFDHEVDNGEMRQEEARLITYFDLPKSLIVRTEEM